MYARVHRVLSFRFAFVGLRSRADLFPVIGEDRSRERALFLFVTSDVI